MAYESVTRSLALHAHCTVTVAAGGKALTAVSVLGPTREIYHEPVRAQLLIDVPLPLK
jgi:hypothetical protein